MEYRVIIGYPNYTIAKDGTLKNTRGQVIKPRYDKRGYERVNLSHKGSKKTYFIHQLVMNTFSDVSANKYATIDHIDGNKTNNHINNLRYVTLGENVELALLKRNDKINFYIDELLKKYSDDEVSNILEKVIALMQVLTKEIWNEKIYW